VPAVSSTRPARVGILLSGRGSNFAALAAAIGRGELPAEIALVVSNVPGAPGLERARELGLATRAVDHREAKSREAHDARMIEVLAVAGVEWICLAGYMRLLSAPFVEAFDGRILNIHPSLLPAFPGLHAQRQALEAGVRIAGCTVHFVDTGLDSGPIVAQRAVPVLDEDDEAALSERILVEEHRLYAEALCRLLVEPWRIEGRRVRFAARMRVASPSE
jgi:phosphoribosylglycinamide formyltransferase-1